MPSWQRRFKNFISEKVIADWRYKLLALGAALVIWVYVAGQQSIQAVYSAPVLFENIPEGLAMERMSRTALEVTVSGPRNRVLAIKDRQVTAVLDLSKMKAGRNDYRFTKEDILVPKGIEVKAYFPRHIIIRLIRDNQP